LLGLLREGEAIAARVLKNLDVDLAQTRDEILKELDPTSTPPESEAEAQQEGDKKDVKRSALLAFGRDLTELAKKGELDPVIGRNNEIERVIQILCRRTKNNPVLLGRAGVGKTAIVEGLAQEIADGKMPELLRDKRIVTFDLALMVAGTKYRGQFEERIQLDKSAVEFLIDKGYDPIYGVRPMRRAVEKFLENPLAEELLRENIQQGDTLEVRAASEQLALKVTVGGAT
jgi:ATP-dependent Clp protease ATP-binding subunit ClpA